jgi:alanyl-tRNA synthetase
MSMTSDEIRSAFIDFFVERGHKHLPSGSLVPATFDPSVLLTTAGMHPLKPYFQGLEEPPARRLTTCQKCFRSTDIDNVGNTLRHLTFFEMLGNFSIGDYFKAGAVPFAWELSTQGFGFKPADIWVTVHRGDERLGLGPDNEAIEEWLKIGVPAERIVLLGSEDNFWQAGPTGPCGPCSELYLDRGLKFGGADDRPGDDTERFLEFWNLVFMQYDQKSPGTLTPLPAQSIDTGMGLNRMASILQGVESVFETDEFQPLIALGEELSGRKYGADQPTTRALRILADHSRAMTFLIADGVVPSNEERGFVLRRVMRRAIQQGRSIGLEPGFAPKFAERVIELMGNTYAELHEQREAILKWVAAEEEGFGRTLEQGNRLLEQLIDRAREAGAGTISAADAFQLHDTYGFPIDVTRELAEQAGLTVDRTGFDELMTAQRERGRAAAAGETGADTRDAVRAFARDADFTTTFTGYETTEQHTTVGAVDASNGRVVVKLVESPFYATGGGQIADVGSIECEDGDCVARVVDVLRLGDDQAVALEVEAGELKPGERVVARVDRAARHATEANHTATHLLHAALRERLGTHVRQAGSYVGPDKLRFDFTHGSALSAEDVAAVEDRVNELVLANQPVRAITTTLDEARSLGAMALFGEKYGDVVRMVEVGDGQWSRELCGGTHVRSTAEIGVFKLTGEGSSAANVRRIEAITGPEAVGLLRREDALLRDVAARLRTTPDRVPEAIESREARLKEAEKAAKQGGGAGIDVDALAAQAEQVGGVTVLTASVEADDDALLATMDQLKSKLGDAAIVLGAPADGKVALVAAVAPALIERGVRAGEIVKVAAGVVGGGGGGRDNMARAGGKDPSKLPDALAAARDAIAAALRG